MRLLRLQAQVGLLGDALGPERLRVWLLHGDRLNRLQGDDAAFAQVLAEAEEALAGGMRVAARPRMRAEDYESGAKQLAANPGKVTPGLPGAAKLPEELTEQVGRVC
jgi:hypothetical protein